MQLHWPLPPEFNEITTQYGELIDGVPHLAIDIGCPEGSSVLASHNGILSYESTLLGGIVARVTGDQCYTRYCHLQGYWADNGEQVKAGDKIALSDNTGTASTGPHLHWECHTPDGVFVNPMEFELKTEVQQVGVGSYQFQGSAASWARQQVKASGVKMIKQIQPDYVDSWFNGDVIGRLWWDGEPDKQLVWQGIAGADAWWVMAKPRIVKCPSIKLWEGPNEEAIDTVVKARLFNEFELRRITILHLNGLQAVSGSTSTGCWEPFVYPYIYDVFRTTDFWEVHEYGMHTMALTDTGHLLRYRRLIKQLKAAGIRVPPIIIGETGIDYASNPITDGWQAQGITAAQYADQLIAYLKEVAKDPEVVLATPFVWSAQGWPSFDITEAVSSLYTNYIKGAQPPVDTFLQSANAYVFPVNLNTALNKYILGKGWSLDSIEFQVQGWVAEWAYDPTNNKRILCRCQAPTWAVSEYATVDN